MVEFQQTSETTQSPSCLKYVFEGMTVCPCGELLRPNKSTLDRIRAAFEALKAPYYRAAPIISRGKKCGHNPWQQDHHKARDALRRCNEKRTSTLRYGIGGKETKSSEHLNWHTLGSTSGSSTSTISRTSTSAMIHFIGGEHDTTTWSKPAKTLTNNKDHCCKRSGYKEATRALVSLHSAEGQWSTLYFHCNKGLVKTTHVDPEVEKFLFWLSFHWAEYFAEPQNSERQQPSIIIFKLVTKPNVVEFVILGPSMARVALSWVA